jgi:hypothetical protein
MKTLQSLNLEYNNIGNWPNGAKKLVQIAFKMVRYDFIELLKMLKPSIGSSQTEKDISKIIEICTNRMQEFNMDSDSVMQSLKEQHYSDIAKECLGEIGIATD